MLKSQITAKKQTKFSNGLSLLLSNKIKIKKLKKIKKNPKNCIRCAQYSLCFPKSKDGNIKFCNECKDKLRSLAIVEGLNFGPEFSFYCNAIFLENHRVYKISFEPKKNLVVSFKDFIIKKSDLPKNRIKKKLDWNENRFFEEIYSVEWIRAHILDFLISDWENSNKKLF